MNPKKANNMNNTLIKLHLCAVLVSALTFMSSCGEALTESEINTDMPIVESYLQEGSNSLTVALYSMEIYLGEDYVLSSPIGGQSLTVNGMALTETSTGTYSLELGEDTLRGQQTFDLSFTYNGKSITAATTIPDKVTGLTISPEYITREESSSSYYFTFDESDSIEINLTWDDPKGDYYQIYIESPATADIPDMGGMGTQFRRRMMQPFRGGSYSTTSREFRTTGTYNIYVYRVNKDYADLYERVSSTDLANPTSAITNAFGVFTAMSVAKTTFKVIATSSE